MVCRSCSVSSSLVQPASAYNGKLCEGASSFCILQDRLPQTRLVLCTHAGNGRFERIKIMKDTESGVFSCRICPICRRRLGLVDPLQLNMFDAACFRLQAEDITP
ncbi:hypothetical protein BC567DRAFT_84834 [Phyllosticta citribraziliensis]